MKNNTYICRRIARWSDAPLYQCILFNKNMESMSNVMKANSTLSCLALTMMLVVPTMVKAQSETLGSPLTEEDSIKLAWMEYEYISDADRFIADTHRKGRYDQSSDRYFDPPEENIYGMMYRLEEAGYGYTDNEADDVYGSSLLKATEQWYEKFVDLLNAHPKSMFYPFDMLRKRTGMDIICSPDTVIRFYQWSANLDPDDAGMQHVVQFKTTDGRIVAMKDQGDPTGKEAEFPTFRHMHDIIPLETDDGMVYLMLYKVDIPQDAVSENICAVAVKGGSLVHVPIFQIKKKLKSSICVFSNDYRITQYTFQGEPQKDNWLVRYDKVLNNVTIRETDDDGNITGAYSTYWFDGKVFK